MKKLELKQMEVLLGGDSESMDGGDCALAIASLCLTFAGAFVTTTPIGAGIFLGSMIVSGIGMKACK